MDEFLSTLEISKKKLKEYGGTVKVAIDNQITQKLNQTY